MQSDARLRTGLKISANPDRQSSPLGMGAGGKALPATDLAERHRPCSSSGQTSEGRAWSCTRLGCSHLREHVPRNGLNSRCFGQQVSLAFDWQPVHPAASGYGHLNASAFLVILILLFDEGRWVQAETWRRKLGSHAEQMLSWNF